MLLGPLHVDETLHELDAAIARLWFGDGVHSAFRGVGILVDAIWFATGVSDALKVALQPIEAGRGHAAKWGH
jgi:hypothetical protein